MARNEFLIRRLHSLSGLVPVGAYMCVHLLTNASVLDSSATFQRAVHQIHSLGNLLPLVEWVFIFIPILFHGVIGVVIIRGGLPNYGSYKYTSNLRYTLQRATGMIAFVFIVWHVFHMHGWFHFEAWKTNVAEPLRGAQFSPYNAASSLGVAMAGVVYPLLYATGILSCVYHLANGIWTMGITWGVWVSPAAQKRADHVCIAFGIALAVVGLSALGGAVRLANDEGRRDDAEKVEARMWKAKTDSGEVDLDAGDHKRAEHLRKHTAPK
ncbi:MAG: succinate dehydrogenase [Planctomycetaceae bacterium]|nr:succinate dehydrogenase [Planctomycetaceae bacterium]